MHYLAALRASSRVPLLQAAKSAIATVLAWMIAGALVRSQLPVFAGIAALLVVQPSLGQSLSRAIERSLGVIAGVLVAFLIGLAFGDDYWIVLLTIVVAIGVAWALRLTATSSTQVAISAMLVLSVGANTSSYAVDRIIDTLIGAAIGVIVNVAIVPPVQVAPARDSVDALIGEIAERLDALAAALSAPQTAQQLDELLVLARLLRPMQEKANAAIAAAEESLSINPLRSRHEARLAEARELRDRGARLVARVVPMTRTLHDRYRTDLVEEPEVSAIAEEARRAAHDLRLLRLDRAAAGESRPEEPPALTRPLVVSTPDPTHWILIGSLLEDLRRIREEITGEDAL
ncbi:FUSC family protein [Gryllotalpicola ginsengisoli]|uniref:FUSC family protein n=1 Tax=Gryllotalpicola ginsengisoli TaxID=444608 RepID=UPI0003B4F5A3|nr:FUSC family protein [Gryllotalpicola ginsengisoli]